MYRIQESPDQPIKRISKKVFLETIKAKQFDDYNKALEELKQKHKKARKSTTLMKSECFELIKKFMDNEGCLLKIQDMCLLADVSRSGYYNWVKSAPTRERKDSRDAEDFALIEEAFKYRGFPKGARSIHMCLLHREEPVLMNVKKIERLMRKFNIKFELKGNSINRKISQMAVSGRTTPKFTMLDLPEATKRREKFFMMTAKHKFPNDRVGFLIVITDLFTKQILASVLAARDTMDLIKNVVEKFVAKENLADAELLYVNVGSNGPVVDKTSVKYLLENEAERNRILDMAPDSDNAPKEHFIGFARDEVSVNAYKTSFDVIDALTDWIDYYNKDRYVWNLGKLSPDEYDNYLVTGYDPLAKFRRNEND